MIHASTLQKKALAFLRSSELELDQVARFTGAKSLGTVQDWISGKQTLRGLRLNSLWWLMAAMGVATPELDEVSDFGHYLGELLAFDVIDLDQARVYCGTKQEQAVFDVIRGNRNVVGPTATYEQLKAKHDAALQDKRAQKLGYVLPATQPASQLELSVSAQTMATAPDDSSDGTPTVFAYPEKLARNRHLIEIAQALGGILPLVHYLVSDECTPAERAMVRELIGTDAMFDLSTVFNRLCSERANTQGK